MNKDADQKKPRKAPPKSREDRLKAALKANMTRRKQQARARADDTGQTRANTDSDNS